MRYKTIFTLSFLVLTFPLFGQFNKGSVEMAFSGQFNLIKHETDGVNNISGIQADKSTHSILFLYLQPSFCFINRVALEPEILLMKEKGEKTALGLSANLVYHIPTRESSCVPFILLGYGASNSIPYNRTFLTRMSDKMDIHLFNAGAGLKVMMGKRASFRVEYRYQHYSWSYKTVKMYESDDLMAMADTKSHFYFNSIMIGLSVFLKRAPQSPSHAESL
jgi:hypothetical protein